MIRTGGNSGGEPGRIKSFAKARKNLILLLDCSVRLFRPVFEEFEKEGWRLK